MQGLGRQLAALAALVALAACGGGSSYAPASREYYPGAPAAMGAETTLASAPEPMAMAESGGSGSGYADEDVEEEASDTRGSGGEGRPMYAQNVPVQHAVPPSGGQPTQTGQTTPPQTATDVPSGGGPLLIYTAELYLSVFEVQQTQRAVVQIATELHGFLSYQDDQKVIIRVPAASFRDALTRVEAVGDVTHRNIQAMDVSEEFRDLNIRLRNAEAVRDRLEALLAQARNVAEALQVQNELARVTEEIERMKGRLRFLQDRLAFSTITVLFQPRPTDNIGEPDRFRLPFPWLDELGLPNLLNLRSES